MFFSSSPCAQLWCAHVFACCQAKVGEHTDSLDRAAGVAQDEYYSYSSGLGDHVRGSGGQPVASTLATSPPCPSGCGTQGSQSDRGCVVYGRDGHSVLCLSGLWSWTSHPCTSRSSMSAVISCLETDSDRVIRGLRRAYAYELALRTSTRRRTHSRTSSLKVQVPSLLANNWVLDQHRPVTRLLFAAHLPRLDAR